MKKLANASFTRLTVVAIAALAAACSAPEIVEGRRGTSSRIIGGTADSSDPAVVAVLATNEQVLSTCTGEVIAPTYVLTASHCVDALSLGFVPTRIVVATSADTTTATAADLLQIRRAIPHPLYDRKSGANDIALVELSTPTSIAPIPFHRGSIDGIAGQKGRAIGYGQTIDGDVNSAGKKNQVELTISDIDAQSFLATALPGTQCHGDSGGPVLFPIDGRETIIGIGWHTVLQDGSCVQGVRDLRVDPFAAWIDLMTGAGLSSPSATLPPPPALPTAPDDVPPPAAPPGGSQTLCCYNGDRYECPDQNACLGGFDLDACRASCADVSCIIACANETSGRGPTNACTRVGACD